LSCVYNKGHWLLEFRKKCPFACPINVLQL
jgi:hypothetical protein